MRPKTYSPTITATMSNAELRKAKATYSSRREDYLLYDASEMGLMRFLTTNVEDTWYQELENTETFYTEVTAFKIMLHLKKCSGGRHTIDSVKIMSDMQQYFDESERIPVYINMMDTAQKSLLK